jgi:type IV secretion system protein TrbL
MSGLSKKRNLYWAIVFLWMLPTAAQADTAILNATGDLFAQAMTRWYDIMFPAARNLFLLLMTIEVAWTAIELTLAGDFQVGTFFRRVLAVLFFFVLLVNAREWLPALVDSFVALGSRAAGANIALSPTAIIDQGIALAGQIAERTSALFGVFSINGLLIFASALLVLLSFGLIALQFLLALVEVYLVLGAGVLLIGFAGSRWSIGYTERFLGYAFSVGVKLFVLTLIIGTGTSLASSWFPTLQVGGLTNFMAVGLSSLVFLGLTFASQSVAGALQGGASSLGLGTAFAGALSVASAATPVTRAAYATVRAGAQVGGSATAALYRAAVNAGRVAVRNPADPYRR